MRKIIEFLDNHLVRSGLDSIDPVEANALLSKAGILHDSKDRPGKPIRDLLRKGQLPHAFQAGGKGSRWIIPHSCRGISKSTGVRQITAIKRKDPSIKIQDSPKGISDFSELKVRLERARLKYRPKELKILLVAEAPPDNIERFFYYESVLNHDYLFLGIAEALYPDLKEKYIKSSRKKEMKISILERLKIDGFYLLDLSELPLSILNKNLVSQLSGLTERVSCLANSETKVIFIKANVYDTAFSSLNDVLPNLIDARIPFPGQGWQKEFQVELRKALDKAGYSKVTT